MFRLIMPLMATLVFTTISIQVGAASSNLNKAGLSLEGFDPVSYFRPEASKKGPLKGDEKFETKLDDSTFRFHSEANKQEFLKNPSKYAPAFGGWCAYAIAEKKEKVEVDVKSFLIQDGRLLLFYKGFLADTRDTWQNTKSKSPATFLKDANVNWPEVKNKAP